MSLRAKARPNKRRYEDLDDSRDTRVPLHNDEAFMHGLSFTSKFIGSLEVSKPSSRVEIVSCMRRIRYEFRAKGVKKMKATINISVSGVKITKYVKKKRKRQRKKTPEDLVVKPQIILESPIYRIFYVSHDSLDKKIFSFIARVETAQNKKTFICAVFKAYKKSHALRVVRTIGQAFDICCKLQQSPDAANIPGLMPPEKLKKMAEKKQGDEGTCVDGVDEADAAASRKRLSTATSDLLNNFNLDMSVLESTELPPNAIVTLDDDYEVALLEYQKHLYAFGQSLLLNSADVQQSTNEEALLDGYKLSAAQRQLMILQFRLKQDHGLANAFMPPGDGQATADADSVLSKPLPTPPPNRLKVAGRGKFNRPGVGVTENASRDDSTLLPRFPDGEAGGDDVPTDLLVDTSIPEAPSNPVNPFTSVTLLEDDSRPMPQSNAQWVEMQRAQTAQLQLLKDQLSAETASRIDAQAKSHHAMRQNKVLAAYIMHIGSQLKRRKSPVTSADDVANSGRVVTTEVVTAGQGQTTLYQRTPDPLSASGAAAAGASAADAASPATPPPTGASSTVAPSMPSDMDILQEILAASQLDPQRSSSKEEDFEPRRSTPLLDPPPGSAGVSNGQGGRFSPFAFAGDQAAATSTPATQGKDGQEERGEGDGDGRFSPFQGFQSGGGPDNLNSSGSRPVSSDPAKPVVLFELPRAPTPLSDMDNDSEKDLYPAGEPAYIQLQDGTD